MSTQAQIKANQKNAHKSTGPRTAAGKNRSAQNHFRHGLAGRFTVLPDEDATEFQQLLTSLQEEHGPTTPTESLLVARMAEHWWLTQRALRLQNDCFAQNPPTTELAIYLRYQTTHERAFSRALNDLLKLRRARRAEEAHHSQQALRQQRHQIGFERQQAQQATLDRRTQLEQIKQSTAQLKQGITEIDLAHVEDRFQTFLHRSSPAAPQPSGSGIV